MHWDGVQWAIVPSPNVGTTNNRLYAVVALSRDNVWAVGDMGNTLVEHWDGNAWSVVPSPNPGTQYNTLFAVSAVSGADVWAVGYTCCWFSALIEHYQDACPPSPTPTSTGMPFTPTPVN